MRGSITDLIGRGESEVLEIKGAKAPFDALARAVCGLLNQRGGLLLWGISDDLKIQGIGVVGDRDKKLSDYLLKALRPQALISVAVEKVEDKNVVVVDVPVGPDKPYSVNREIWVRIGRETLKATPEISSQIVEKSVRKPVRWERNPAPGFEIEHCDEAELATARQEISKVGRYGMEVPSSSEELLRDLKLTRSGQFTYGAVVLFAANPRNWVPNLAVRVVSYSADKSSDLSNDVSFEGPAIRVLKEVFNVIQQRTGFSSHFNKSKLEREDRPAYAVFAIREALVNAMVHRDYESNSGDLRVEIFLDHLIIRNPAALPDGWTPEKLTEENPTILINPDLARVFYLRLLMDQLGAGTGRLVEECLKLKAKRPIWKVKSGILSLTLFKAPEPTATDVPLLARQLEFLKTLKARQEFKLVEYTNAAGVSERQGRRDLIDMEEAGMLKRIGKGPATSYQRTERKLT